MMPRVRTRLLMFLGGLALVGTLAGLPRVVYCQITAPSDAKQIQQQIDSAAKQGGGVVRLPAKTYVLTQSLIIRSGVTLQGAGRDKTVLRLADNVNDAVIKIDFAFLEASKAAQHTEAARVPFATIGGKQIVEVIGALVNHDLAIKDLTLHGNAKGNPASWFGGICLPYSYNYRIENVRIRNARGLAGIYTSPAIASTDPWQAMEVKSQQNYLLDNIVEHCVMAKKPATGEMGYGNGIYITARYNQNVLVKGNVVRNNQGAGIFLEDMVQYIFVEQNEVYDNQDAGIWVNETKNSSIRFNKIHRNAARGLLIGGSYPDYSQNNVFYGNEIYDNGYEGILFQLAEDKSFPTYCILAGNWVWNNATYGIAIRGPQHNTVSFNFCYDDQPQKTQRVGLQVFSPNNLVVNNYLRGNKETELELGEGNTYVPYDYEKGWDPFRLVGSY